MKKLAVPRASEDVGQLLHIAEGSVYWYNHFGKLFGSINIHTLHHPGIPFLGEQKWVHIPVSSLECKALRSHRFILTSTRLNKPKNWWLFLNLSEKSSHRVKGDPQNWRDKQANRENQLLLELKPMIRNLHGNQNRGRTTWTITNKLLEAQCGQIWGFKTLGWEVASLGGRIHFCEL